MIRMQKNKSLEQLMDLIKEEGKLMNKLTNKCTDLELMTMSFITQHNAFFVFRTILNGLLHFQAITPAFTCLWNKKPKMH